VATTTTDPTPTALLPAADPDARPARSGVSVRTRITAAVALLVTLALTGAGAIVYAIEAERIEKQMVAEIDQELAEFAALQEDGINPETRRPFADVDAMLDTFLARNVPDDNEILVSWYRGGPRTTSSQRDFVESRFFRDVVGPLVADNGTTRVDVPDYGAALITVQTVRSGEETGALVVVTYLDLARSGLRETMRTYAIVALLSLLLVTAIASWLSGRLLAPLRTLRETAEDIGETDLAQRLPVTGNDDITALTRTVNGMLDRLESAFVGQRQFLDDAGHELKTPLTVLRGHLELLNAGSAEDTAETRELLLDEVDRMSRLVGDLILLAKSDRPDFVRPRPVDLGRLTEELLAKSRGLGDRAWTLDGVADTVVVADEQRLTQAVLQLADNAVKHTRTGDVVAIGTSYDGKVASLWVRDTGPGVPAADRSRVFERFGRSAVPDGDEGVGLGLSIVRAIVTAHGGTVTAEPAAPTGARFVMTLPVRPDRSTQEDPWRAS
jgi:signal transduction histidine kinase